MAILESKIIYFRLRSNFRGSTTLRRRYGKMFQIKVAENEIWHEKYSLTNSPNILELQGEWIGIYSTYK